jgi:hypothetical protein
MMIDACTAAILREASREVPVPTLKLATALHVVNPQWQLPIDDIEAIIRHLAANHSIPVLQTNDELECARPLPGLPTGRTPRPGLRFRPNAGIEFLRTLVREHLPRLSHLL